jgi:cytoskeletal protein CcmA (bactofilin family)
MYIEGDLRVGGVVEGEVEVTGDVAIDDLAKVKASVTARDVSISGSVVGAIVARKRLEVTRSGSLIGDVRVARLTIQDGATFSGKVSMGNVADAPAKAAQTKPVVPEAKPVAVEPKAIASEPAVQEVKPTAPIVAAPIASPLAAQAPIAPPPAAKTPIAPPPAAKAPIAPPPAAKAPMAPPQGAKAPAAPPKTQPKKGKPKRR